jgi:hypothetical protein
MSIAAWKKEKVNFSRKLINNFAVCGLLALAYLTSLLELKLHFWRQFKSQKVLVSAYIFKFFMNIFVKRIRLKMEK